MRLEVYHINMTRTTRKHLVDLGEKRILNELVMHYLGDVSSDMIDLGIGDDAAVLGKLQHDDRLVLTIDSCPTPVVDILGVGSWRDWGRMAGVISLSDIAAMGAAPIAFLSATTMNPDMNVSDYEEYISGLSSVCEEYSTRIIGGNIREGNAFSATTVGIGICKSDQIWKRNGAENSDILVCVGSAGLFWSATLDIMQGKSISELTEAQSRALFCPYPKLGAVAALQRSGVKVNASMDCSDGLGASIVELCQASDVGVVIDYSLFQILPEVRAAASKYSIPLERLLLSWGDWQLLLSVPEASWSNVDSTLRDVGCTVFRVGRVISGQEIRERWPGKWEERLLQESCESVRFHSTSYMSNGLDSYVERLRHL